MAGFDRCHTDTSAVFVPSRHSACNSLRQQNGSIHGIPWSRKAPAQSRPLPAPSGFGSASARHSQLRFIIPHASSLRQKNGGSVRKNPGGDTHYTGSGYSRPVSAPALKSLRQQGGVSVRGISPDTMCRATAFRRGRKTEKQKGRRKRHPFCNFVNARPLSVEEIVVLGDPRLRRAVGGVDLLVAVVTRHHRRADELVGAAHAKAPVV